MSVIIPVYNGEEVLERCLEALAEQDGVPKTSYEVIVVNNDSDDNSAEIIKTNEGKYPWLRYAFEEKKSSYAARNRGLDLAKGKYMVFTDIDCIPTKHWLAGYHECAKEMEKRISGPFLLAGPVKLIMEDESNPYAIYDRLNHLNQELFVREKGFAATANLLVAREVFDRIGTFNEGLISGGDSEFGNRASAVFPLEYCPEAKVCHPVRDSFSRIISKNYRIALGFQQKHFLKHGSYIPAREVLKFLFPSIGYLRPEYFPKFTVDTEHEIPAGDTMRIKLLVIDMMAKFAQFLGRSDGRGFCKSENDMARDNIRAM